MGVDFREFIGLYTGPYYLQHHGTKNMRWGFRRYQNKDGSLTPAGKLRYSRGFKQNASKADIKFVSKVDKNREKLEEKAFEKKVMTEEEKKVIEKARNAEKERILREGTAEEVLKYRNEISNTELSNALNRIKWTRELNDIAQKEKDEGWNRIDKVMDKVGKVSKWTKTGVELYNNSQSVKKIFDDLSKTVSPAADAVKTAAKSKKK